MRGADWPWQGPGRDHGAAMEGYYWRFADPARRRAVIALCGVCKARDGGRWAVVALAGEPGGLVRSVVVPAATARADAFGVRAGSALAGTLDELRVDLGAGAWLQARLTEPRGWHGRALGPAHLVPGLPQYWAPLVLGARVEGEARIGGTTFPLGGARAYVEKNWGPAFPGDWWWGQAFADGDDDVCVSFAGGEVLGARASAVVVRFGDEVVRAPLALVRDWTLRGRAGRHTVVVRGAADGADPVELPVPVPAERRVEDRSRQWLAGRLAVTVRRGRREVLRAESTLAGLERGAPG